MKRPFPFRFLAALPLLLLSLEMQAQYVLQGEDAAAVRWMQLNGPNYRLIYPRGADSLAMRYLWLMEKYRTPVMYGLGKEDPAHLPVVLHNRTVRSNGSVIWTPKRMELYSLPAVSGYPQDWATQLAIHESRHVGQMNHFNRGVYKVLYCLLGEQSPAIGVGVYSSRWLMEGDAVVTETELSPSGRGRNAEFMEYYRASFLQGLHRRWDQMRYGSRRYHTPNHYPFGYLMNSTVRMKGGGYGHVGDVFSNTVKRFYNPKVRDWAYRRIVGLSQKEILYSGRQMMDSIWRAELARRGACTWGKSLLDDGSDIRYAEYRWGVAAGRDSMICIKTSYDLPSRLVLVHGGKERTIRSFSGNVEGLSIARGVLYYTENIQHPRWRNEVYGKVFRYDLKTGNLKRLSARTFYGSPQADPEGRHLVVEEFLPEGGTRLAVLDARTGAELDLIPAPLGGEVKESVWAGDYIYAYAVTAAGGGIFRYPWPADRQRAFWEPVIREQHAQIEHLSSAGESLCFTSDIDGVRNAYLLHPDENRLDRLTNDKYGIAYPHIHDGKVYYSALDLNGRRPEYVPLGCGAGAQTEYRVTLEDGRLSCPYRYAVAEELSRQARETLGKEGVLDGDGEPAGARSLEEFSREVQARPYRKAGHLFRFHSWAPVYYNVDKIMSFDFDRLYEAITAGATVYSQNTLGTAVTMLGYSYHKGYHGAHASFKYTGWTPAFRISADVNAKPRERYGFVKEGNQLKAFKDTLNSVSVQADAMVYLPLDFSRGGWFRSLVPSVQWTYDNIRYSSLDGRQYSSNNQLMASLRYSQNRGVAHSGIFPRWGFGADVKWKTSLDQGSCFGSAVSASAYAYLPGLWKTHGIKLAGAFQEQDTDGKLYYLGNMIRLPRGFQEDVYAQRCLSGSFDYAFPVYLGDVGIWWLLYLKRLKVIPFADYAVCSKAVPGASGLQRSRLYSYGTDVMVDCYALSIGVEFSIGVRYARNGVSGIPVGVPWDRNHVGVLFSLSL